ncbi:MAG: hypothetical protein QXR02_07105 [Acidilobaceae archaeon]
MSVCITRAKSFLKLKKKGLTNGEYPEVRSISIWLDDRLWKLDGYTSVRISTHKGLVNVDINTHKQFWRYVNSVWRLRSKCRVKLSRGERRLTFYFVFVREVELYLSKGYITVDVNENSVAALIYGRVYIFEANIHEITFRILL